MTPAPDADRLARSMLALLGHDDDDHPAGSRPASGTWSKAPDFAADPERAAAVREASARDRERYLTAGLTPVDCRFCHVTVAVKKLGAGTHCRAVEHRTRPSAARRSPRSAPRAATAAAADRARSSPTASGTPWRRVASRRSRPPRLPATAEHLRLAPGPSTGYRHFGSSRAGLCTVADSSPGRGFWPG